MSSTNFCSYPIKCPPEPDFMVNFHHFYHFSGLTHQKSHIFSCLKKKEIQLFMNLVQNFNCFFKYRKNRWSKHAQQSFYNGFPVRQNRKNMIFKKYAFGVSAQYLRKVTTACHGEERFLRRSNRLIYRGIASAKNASP